jgi:O-acetylserine/cysteine efflux transporter
LAYSREWQIGGSGRRTILFMNLDRRPAIAALATAGVLWGTTIPLSKLALEWLSPWWLTVARFGLAAIVLLVVARPRISGACTPGVLAWGALGYGGSIMLQNAGIERTSISHAALLVGATPVLVAIIVAVWRRIVATPMAWTGYAVSLTGVALIAGGSGGGATIAGDGLILASLLFSAGFLAAQSRLLNGRDPVAVSAVQFLAASIAGAPVAAIMEGVPAAPSSPGTLLAVVGLALGGTLLPFTLFAYGQARVSAEVAGAFINLEPLVGAAAGVLLFGDPVGVSQAIGGAAILAGIALSTLKPQWLMPTSDAGAMRILWTAMRTVGHLSWRGLSLDDGLILPRPLLASTSGLSAWFRRPFHGIATARAGCQIEAGSMVGSRT